MVYRGMDDLFVPHYLLYGVGVATFLLAILVVTANGLLLFVIYKDPCKCLRKPSTGFIIALSASNLMIGLFSDIAYAVAVLEGIYDGHVNLNLGTPSMISGIITYTSEILLVVALTLERVVANGCVAFHRNHFRLKTTVVTSCFIWLYSLCFGFLQVFEIDESSYLLADIYLHHAAPFVAITLANLILYFLIRRHHRAIIPVVLHKTQLQNSITTRQTLQAVRERQLAIVVMLIGLLLFLFLVPYFIIVVLDTYCSSCNQKVLQTALVISIPIVSLNSVVNPYIYAWRLPQYKRSIKMILPSCRQTIDRPVDSLKLSSNDKRSEKRTTENHSPMVSRFSNIELTRSPPSGLPHHQMN